MRLHITTLSENTAGMGGCLAEWGLSILVQTDEGNILLDTGTSHSAVQNADTLGVDLNKIDKIVLSHGHGDHTGGLRDVLRRMKKEVGVNAHPDVWQAKYSRRKDEPDKFIGIPFQREALESLGARFNLTKQPVRITENIMTTGEVPMVTAYETIDTGLYVKDAGGLKPDQMMDDLALVIKTEQGLVVVLGCAHRGMINTLYHARKITGIDRVYAIIGGSHLINTSEERLWHTIGAIRELGIQKLGLCHCTDLPAASVIFGEFGEKFFFNKSGTKTDLP